MRKKDLISQNRTLFDNVNQLKSETELLRKKLEEKENEIARLSLAPSEDKDGETVKSQPLKDLEKRAQGFFSVPELDYAAKAIGKTVMSAAHYCDEISQSLGADGKELVNLILGRCEVAKSDILSAASSECDLEIKQKLIDDVCSEAQEYFLSVSAQKNQ